MNLTRYFMFNAAVPVEAFDESAWDDTALYNPMVHQEWIGFPSRTWAAKWHELFSGGAARNHSWQKQERFKGRASDFVSGFGGTSDMGWGFSQMGVWSQGIPPMYNALYVGNQFVMDHVRTNAYSLAQANAASDAQLVSDPVFMHILTLGVPTSTMSQADHDVCLARGIPALSAPMGSGSVHELSGIAFKDLNVYSLDPNWPRDGDWDGWRHGDIKAIAFPFVQELFLDVLGAMSDE